jgi:hypothetical protein
MESVTGILKQIFEIAEETRNDFIGRTWTELEAEDYWDYARETPRQLIHEVQNEVDEVLIYVGSSEVREILELDDFDAFAEWFITGEMPEIILCSRGIEIDDDIVCTTKEIERAQEKLWNSWGKLLASPDFKCEWKPKEAVVHLEFIVPLKTA